MNQSRRFLTFSLLVILGVATVLIFNGKVFAQNRLFLSVNATTGGVIPTEIGEVDLASGSFDYTSIFDVPRPPNGSFVSDLARDLIVDEQGNFLVYNGTSTTSLLWRNRSARQYCFLVGPVYVTGRRASGNCASEFGGSVFR